MHHSGDSVLCRETRSIFPRHQLTQCREASKPQPSKRMLGPEVNRGKRCHWRGASLSRITSFCTFDHHSCSFSADNDSRGASSDRPLVP